jgi:hypothetical protein
MLVTAVPETDPRTNSSEAVPSSITKPNVPEREVPASSLPVTRVMVVAEEVILLASVVSNSAGAFGIVVIYSWVNYDI